MKKIKIGTSVIDITAPLELGILMSSVKELYLPFDSVRLPLKGRILVMEYRDKKIAIIALDLLGISDSAVGGWDNFKKNLSDIILADDIIVTCTHTHSSQETAGLTDLYKTQAFKKWLVDLENKIKKGIQSAVGNLQECEMSTGVSELKGFSLQRRIHADGKIIMSDSIQPIDPKYFELGPIDNRIKAVKFTNSKGENVATIVHNACHPVHDMCSTYVSPDFPGELCLDLETHDPNGMYLFFNGACGDVNPPTVSDGAEEAKKHGEAIAGKVKGMHWKKTEATSLKLLKSELTFHIREKSGMSANKAEIYRIITLEIGGIVFVFLSGENFTDTASSIEQTSPYEMTIVVGYAENYVGYIPTQKIFEEGGYEIGPGKWSYLETGAQRSVIEQAIQMINQ